MQIYSFAASLDAAWLPGAVVGRLPGALPLPRRQAGLGAPGSPLQTSHLPHLVQLKPFQSCLDLVDTAEYLAAMLLAYLPPMGTAHYGALLLRLGLI